MLAATNSDTGSMTNAEHAAASLAFEAPDGGSWMLDTTHHGRRPVSRYMQPIAEHVFPRALGVVAEKYGLPLAEFRVAMVHGCMYVRPMGIGEPDNPKGEPPLLLMKLISRVHPELRKRRKVATKAWATKLWRTEVDQWFDRTRPGVVDRLLEFQAVDLGSLDNEALATHVNELTTFAEERVFESGSTHGGDIIPVGDYMAHIEQWGIDPSAAAHLLSGASPTTFETALLLRPVGQAVAAATYKPTSLDELRALDAAASAAIDEWLSYHANRLVTSDDIDGETLIERPDLQLKALLAAAATPTAPVEPDSTAIRSRVPADQRSLFDELLAEARYGLRLRDDNVGVNWNWPVGLIRRALLAAAERMVAEGRLAERDHIIECSAEEVQALLLGEQAPTRAEIAERWSFRQIVIASNPPDHLGPQGGEPPIAAFPSPLARATAAMVCMIDSMQGEPATAPLTGTGVGTQSYTGRVLVATDAIDALERLEPGDVVVTPLTGPSWNSLLPSVGALIVEEGGPMSHAAIVAREFAIPTIVSATGATSQLSDGQRVTVDPVAGRITVHDE